MKVQSRTEDKVRIKNLKSLFEFFEKFVRDGEVTTTIEQSNQELGEKGKLLYNNAREKKGLIRVLCS